MVRLAACLNQLAQALRNTGRIEEGVREAQRMLRIVEDLGQHVSIAKAHRQIASFLHDQYRYPEADDRYSRALQAALAAGDQGLQGAILKDQACLAEDGGNFPLAQELYKNALDRFQMMNDEGAVMELYNLLGLNESKSGRFPEARAWYEKSREIARRRNDTEVLGVVYDNLSVVSKNEGQNAQAAGNESLASEKFQEAEGLLQESLRIKIPLANEPQIATTHSQLAIVYVLLGDLDRAEEHAHRAREIRERLQVPEVFKTYVTLAKIAAERGQMQEAIEWRRKSEGVQAELRSRASGDR